MTPDTMDWKATLKALKAWRGELVQVGVQVSAEEGPGDPMMSMMGILDISADRSKFLLKGGPERHAPVIGMFRVPPAPLHGAERWDEDSLEVHVGGFSIVVIRVREGC